jgi:hypothetical protein
MTAEEKLEQARRDLAQFETEHRLSVEEARANAQVWLNQAQRVSEIELRAIFSGSGPLEYELLSATVLAFVLRSPQFETWIGEHLETLSLPTQKKRDAQLRKLNSAVRAAETEIIRAELEEQKREAESKLATLATSESA